jgi:hypothetical protein
MVVLELDPKGGVRKQFRYHARKFQQFFLRHSLSEKSVVAPAWLVQPANFAADTTGWHAPSQQR